MLKVLKPSGSETGMEHNFSSALLGSDFAVTECAALPSFVENSIVCGTLRI